MAALILRFQNLFRRRETTVAEPATIVEPPPRPLAATRLFQVEMDRRSIVTDCRGMYDTDTRAQGVIDTLAADAVKDGFTLEVSGRRAAEAQAMAEETLERVGFWDNIEDWVRETLNEGDTFLEMAATQDGDIVGVSRKPTLELYRWSDEFDQFYDPRRAFFWTEQWWNGSNPPGDAVYFAEWQMIHARGGRRSNRRYGRPVFASARKSFKRMSEGELDVAIRRKTRAGMKYVHSLEDASPADIDAYRERNQAVLNDPFAAVADFFSNKRTSIQAIQGDARLGEIEDVVHHIRTWWVAAPVPMSLLGYGQDLNRDVLDKQAEQYDGRKEQYSNWVTAQFVKPLIERQWLLKGIWPEALTWSANWSNKKPLTAVGLKDAGAALAALRATGMFDDPTLLQLFGRFVPDFDVEMAVQAAEARMADELARVAGNATTDVGSNGLSTPQV
ncbi:MAG: hypothetical protein AB7R40_22225 [Nitrospiraceae bacterium]